MRYRLASTMAYLPLQLLIVTEVSVEIRFRFLLAKTTFILKDRVQYFNYFIFATH